MTAWWSALCSLQTPALPAAALLPGYLHVAWAVVLAAAGAVALRHAPPVWRWGAAALLGVWALWPAAWSAAHGLGLAFQAPSLTFVVLCLWVLTQQAAWRPVRALQGRRGSTAWLLASMAMGWVLLLDLFAVWPISIYAWGYSPLLLASVAGLLALAWAAVGPAGGRPLALLAAVLGLFVLTRWPSGNLWDALLDPWLWVGAHYLGLRQAWGVVRAGQRVRATTRA